MWRKRKREQKEKEWEQRWQEIKAKSADSEAEREAEEKRRKWENDRMEIEDSHALAVWCIALSEPVPGWGGAYGSSTWPSNGTSSSSGTH